MRILTMIIAFLCALQLTGCAYMINGPSQSVELSTVPSGADCRIDGRVVHTPAQLRLPRDENFPVMCELAGYDAAYGTYAGRLSGWVFLGVLNPLSLIVDFATSSAYSLAPGRLELPMRPRAPTAVSK